MLDWTLVEIVGEKVYQLNPDNPLVLSAQSGGQYSLRAPGESGEEDANGTLENVQVRRDADNLEVVVGDVILLRITDFFVSGEHVEFELKIDGASVRIDSDEARGDQSREILWSSGSVEADDGENSTATWLGLALAVGGAAGYAANDEERDNVIVLDDSREPPEPPVQPETIEPPSVTLVNDTGNKTDDGITNDGSLSLDGVLPGATVEYSTDGGVTWSRQFAASEGFNTVQVRQTDADGNVSNASQMLGFFLDTTPPAQLTNIRLQTDSGLYGDDGLTNQAVLLFDRLGDGNQVEYRFAGEDDEAWSTTFVPVQGENQVEIRQVDAAGNGSEPASFTFTFDNVAPQALILLSAPGLFEPVVQGLEEGATVEYRVDGGDWTTNWRALTHGEMQVRQVDLAGNSSVPSNSVGVSDPALAVIFDLSQGTSSDFNNREFAADATYHIYIVVDADGTEGWPPDSINNWDQAWSGAENLGADDKIVLLSGDGSPILGFSGNLVTNSRFGVGEFLTPIHFWSSSISFAAMLQDNGRLLRSVAGTTVSVDLWDGSFPTQANTPEFGYSQYWVELQTASGAAVGGNVTADRGFQLQELAPGSFDVQFNNDPNNLHDDSSWDTDIANAYTPDQLGQQTIYMRLEMAPGIYSDVLTYTFDIQPPELAEIVFFDLTAGTSSSTQGADREFKADTEYYIYIVVDANLREVDLDPAHQWTGSDNLDDDDHIILISDKGHGVIGEDGNPAPTYPPLPIDTVEVTNNHWRWGYGGNDLAARLNLNGGFDRYADNGLSRFVDLWGGSGPTSATTVNAHFSEYFVNITDPDPTDTAYDIVAGRYKADNGDFAGFNITAATSIAGWNFAAEGWEVEFSTDGNIWNTDASAVGVAASSMFFARLKHVGGQTSEAQEFMVSPRLDVVIFDLTSGDSSSHSGRIFQDDVAYKIFIVVEHNSAQIDLDPGQRWAGAEKLGSDDQIILVSATQNQVLGGFSQTVTNVFVGPTYASWQTVTSFALGLNSTGVVTRLFSSSIETADLWGSSSWVPVPGFAHSNSLNYADDLQHLYNPTSQGLA